MKFLPPCRADLLLPEWKKNHRRGEKATKRRKQLSAIGFQVLAISDFFQAAGWSSRAQESQGNGKIRQTVAHASLGDCCLLRDALRSVEIQIDPEIAPLFDSGAALLKHFSRLLGLFYGGWGRSIHHRNQPNSLAIC